MFNTPTENTFYSLLADNYTVNFEGNFLNRKNYKGVMNTIRFSMSHGMRMVRSTNLLCLSVAYQVKLNERDNKYPDFLLSTNKRNLRIEIKYSENEREIAREVNSIDKIKDDAFWFIIFGNKNIKKIEAEATKKDKKIRILSFEDDDILNEITKFFN